GAMNRHQVLTGAVNAGDNCYAVGSVEGVPFTAYTAGCNIVILASNFDRVQIIPGILHGNVQVSCIDASTDVGKIAAAYGKKVCIFEPTPLLDQISVHKLDYKWIQTAALEADCYVTVISWNLEGTKLLTGGTSIQMWHLLCFPEEDTNVHNFKIYENPEVKIHQELDSGGDKMRWDCVWQCRTATPVSFLRFSPDGTLFVSAGKADRLVKIWYESAAKTNYFSHSVVNEVHKRNTHSTSDINYTFIYIAHPRAITGVSWRKTSKYIPRGSVANMLVTSCRDNICRLWVQTLLPEDGLVNFTQIESIANRTVPRIQTQRHRQKLMQRLKHMKSFSQFKKRQTAKEEPAHNEPIPNLPSTYSVHDFHSFAIHGTAMTPGFHFHLAASINAETDIPLVPSLITEGIGNESKCSPNFIIHWMNNKEMVFTQRAEKLLQQISVKIFQSESTTSPHSDVESDGVECEIEDDDYEVDETITAEASKKFRHKLCKKIGKKCKKHGDIKEDVEKDETHHSRQSFHTLSSTSTNVDLSNDSGNASNSQFSEFLDQNFEALLRDWHSSSDLLFSIHPVDGSLLVLVEWLDETSPGSFRQAQVSFSSRFPNAIPLGDAATMSHNVALYSPYTYLDLRSVIANASNASSVNSESKQKSDSQEKCLSIDSTLPTPTVSMITKHNNGSLNLWSIIFGEKTNYSQILSISHSNRVSGHRFRVNDIACHPVLPLLLTTSHHNMPGVSSNLPKSPNSSFSTSPTETPSTSSAAPQIQGVPNSGFCSELILWKVDPVGPLSESGGVTELARINSPETSAFSNVAWIPTLLPSTTLGSISNSPSACFIASDGYQLRVYQAVIDARTLLAEVTAAQRRNRVSDLSMTASEDSTSSDLGMLKHHIGEAFRIVSLQSTSRPGCILELDIIVDAVHDWKSTQLLQVFQDQLIRGDKESAFKCWSEKQDVYSPGLVESSLGAVVDLRHSAVFEEPFYLVVIEKNERGQSVIHMWKLVISSQNSNDFRSDRYAYVPDSNLIQEDSDQSNQSSRTGTPDLLGRQRSHSLKLNPTSFASPLRITTSKICTQQLPIPEDVEVIHATPAAGHLSSSNIYPACFAPYLLCTACSDGFIRFWRCKTSEDEATTPQSPVDNEWVEWVEWEINGGGSEKSSAIELPGTPLYVSCAYSGRIACAYKQGQTFSKPISKTPHKRYMNVNLAIYECESTGGSEWTLEDTIRLRNIPLPETDIGMSIDLAPLIDTSMRNRKTADTLMMRLTNIEDHHDNKGANNIQRLLSVPSYTTMQSLKKIISEQGNQFTLTQKSVVQLDWVSTEDGSHVLTVSVGSKISVFTPVSTDIAQANLQAMNASSKIGTSTARMLLKQASSMAAPLTQPDDIRWMTLRTTQLETADGLPPLPMQMSWVRDGILVVGMDNEMHIYTQWKSEKEPVTEASNELTDSRTLTEKGLLTHAQESSHLRLPTPSTLPRSPSSSMVSAAGSIEFKKPPSNLKVTNEGDQDKAVTLSQLPDFGIFEASRLACPVLPQYHPKQLTELLAFGKIHRVRAILTHLVMSLCTMDSLKGYVSQNTNFKYSDPEKSPRSWTRSRTLSIAAPTSPLISTPYDATDSNLPLIPEEVQLNYTEITSVRPLPLFTLIEADFEKSNSSEKSPKKLDGDESDADGYDSLFNTTSKSQVEETLDEILNRSVFNFSPKQKQSIEPVNLTDFNPRLARVLTKLLTHSHLPGLSSLDQMHLLALADAVASFNPFGEKSAAYGDENEKNKVEYDTSTVSTDSLDDCGLRFLLAMRQHTYLLRCLPLVQRKHLQKQGLGTCNLVWAFHSETQEELIKLTPCILRGNPKWSELKEFGIGWWLRNNFTLKKLIEQVAKASFQVNQNPLDAALFYLAMKKKSLVWGLYRSIGDRKMTDFFQNNFADAKWRKAALKNAYALLGKQRFEHAAAFFLLAGSVWDAVEICLNKLNDLQLAMIIVRLHEGDIETVPKNLKRLLYQEILGCDAEGNNYVPSKAHPDAFLRSMALWILQDYTAALTTLLETDIGYSHNSRRMNEDADKSESNIHPSVFNFYLYLRTHPLVVRRQLAQSFKEKRGKELLYETSADAITPFERRLYFITAHQHFRAGCPSLALEVLSRLPNKIISDTQSLKTENVPEIKTTSTESKSKLVNGSIDKSDAFDWGVPSVPKEPSLDFDWGAPVSSTDKVDTSDFKIDIAVDQCSDEEPDVGLEMKSSNLLKPFEPAPITKNKAIKLDIMAQQLKFIACLKIMMEELSTLATGFEVDGGQLRYHLYVWLEKSVLALKTVCNYRTFSMRNMGMGNSFDGDRLKRQGSSMILNDMELTSDRPTPRESHPEINGEIKPTLHEILLADKLDFEAKLQRSNRRKQWLQANEALLRTLLSYCSLHGSHGGGLASVRMELILLLQELQQERTQHQLLSPLPFPTTLPLLAASVACQKTVIADPLRHLSSMTHDILKTVTNLDLPPLNLPTTYSQVHVLRDLGISLSACVYQSLCDSDNLSIKSSGNKFDFLISSVVCSNSHLLAGNQIKREDTSDNLVPTTPPNKWPGVQSLRALLARDKDEDSPKLHTLLCETYTASYLSQLLYALAACDSHVLYRLIVNDFTKEKWSKLFGGGAKKLIHVAVAPKPQPQPNIESTQSSSMDLLNTLSKQRMKLHMKILQQLNQEKPITAPNIKEDRPTYRELFIPPQMSMLSYLMTKPELPDELISLDYDSSESVESEDEDLDDKFGVSNVFTDMNKDEDDIKYCDREQYAWGIMRCSVIKLARMHLLQFLNVAGVELQDLATTCPSIHAVLKVMERWNYAMKLYMESLGGCPPHFLPNTYVETTRQPGGPAILKYKSILELNNTPFRAHNSTTKPIKRLWNYLVRQEPVQEIFIRYIFGKPKSVIAESKRELTDDVSVKDDARNGGNPEAIRIVHKDQDNISSFCINRANQGLIALSTPKEIQELDMSVLLEPVTWLEEEAEYDIMNLLKAPETLPSTDYLIVQHPSDRLQSSPGGLAMQSSPVASSQSTHSTQTGRSTILAKHHFPGNTNPNFCQYVIERSRHILKPLKRHKTEGTRRMSSHPTLPLYLSGSQDGSVTLWEWNHQQPLLCPRQSGTFAKVTKVMFNQLGNKFGVTDGDGYLSLWQVSLSSANKPFLSMQVHTKQASDFTFLGSSSLIVTAGHSTDHKNVVLWDTLLPSKKSMVTTFSCHEHHGASAVLYAPLNQLLITGGRKGDVFIFDMRQRTKRHNFQAHESAIKCMTLDPGEDFFVTGSADGDIKVWSLGAVHILLYSFPGEHSRSTLFRNIGMGVSHLYVDAAGRLYSCGADGSMKLRQLPDRNTNVVCSI
ncbi:dmX-like protein 2, partial [Dinothrombium tinctorium]